MPRLVLDLNQAADQQKVEGQWRLATGLVPGEFVHTMGDAHLYLNHLDQADRQLEREPLALPRLELNPEVRDIFGFGYDDVQVVGYEALPHIAAQVAV